MPQTIFFSWQADTSTRVGRNLIERALEKALGRIEADTELEEAVRELERVMNRSAVFLPV